MTIQRTHTLTLMLLAPAVLAFVWLAAVPAEPAAGKKYALLAGVNEYSAGSGLTKLDYAENDVEALADLLRPAGFEIVLLSNKEGKKDPERKPTRANFERALKKLKCKATDLVLVGLAGHGVQLRQGDVRESYFIPVDGVPTVRNADTLVSMNGLVHVLEESGAGTRLVLVDACRDEKGRGIRGGEDSGLRLKRGSAVLFSCREGQIAHEPAEFEHGAFFYFVLKGLQGEARNRKGEVTWASLMDYVVREVPSGLPQRLKDQGARQEPDDVTLGTGGAVLVRGDLTPERPMIDKPKSVVISPDKEEKTITNSIGMKLVLIPAGKFMMGSPESEKDRGWDEGPQHEVEITKPFYMGVHEVTQEEYEQVTGTNPSYFKGKKNPVENVSYNDAVEFYKKLSELPEEKRAGRVYRLPTEAEWEYACRAGTKTVFHCGDSLSSAQANFDGNNPYGGAAKGKYLERTNVVGSYPPNAFGLHDMHGNVWEWCADWYDSGYYKDSPRQDPENTKGASLRVRRGGSWSDVGGYCRSARRLWLTPVPRDSALGFRVVAVQPGK